MALTPQLIQSFNQASGLNVPPTPQAQATQSRANEIRAMGKTNTPTTTATDQVPQTSVATSVGDATKETVNNYLGDNGVGAAAADVTGGGNIGKSVDEFGKGNIGAGVEDATLGTASDAVKAVFAPLSAPITTLLSHVAAANAKNPSITGKEIQTPEAQASMQQIQQWAQQNPTWAKTLGDAFNVGTAVLGSGGEGTGLNTTVSDAASAVKNTVTRGATKVQNAAGAVRDAVVGTPAEQEAARVTDANAAETAAKTKNARMLQGVADEWRKPTTINKGTYNKPRAVLSKDPSTPQFLAEQKLNPADHVEDGRYTTKESAQALRETAGKMSADTLRPSLRAADYSTPKTPVTKILPKATKELGNEPYVTPDAKEDVESAITTKAAALQRKYPDGMSLENMHDEKITYAKNGGYNPAKDAAENNGATANRAMASALQHTIEETAPEDIPVSDLNSYFGRYYKAADYLDALNTKSAPVSLTKQVARAGAKLGGMAVGAHFGGLAEEFAGYQIGKALEHALEHLTGASRASFLRNLETTNPEAFTRVQAYLRSASEGNSGIPKLPAGSFIAPPAPSEATQMAGRARELAK